MVVHHAAIVVRGPESRLFVNRAVQVRQRRLVPAQVELRQAAVVVGDGQVGIHLERARERLDGGLVIARSELASSPTVRDARRDAGQVAGGQREQESGREHSNVHAFTTQLKANVPTSTATVTNASRGCAIAEPTNSTPYTAMNNVRE